MKRDVLALLAAAAAAAIGLLVVTPAGDRAGASVGSHVVARCPPLQPNRRPATIHGDVPALALSCDTLYLAGSNQSLQAGLRTGPLAAFDATNGRQLPAPHVVGRELLAIARDRSGHWYLGGSFSSIGGFRCPNLARLDATFRVDRSWCPHLDAQVESLALLGGRLYLSGQFRHAGGQSHPETAAFDLASGKRLPWRARTFGVSLLAVGGGHLLALGTETDYHGPDDPSDSSTWPTDLGELDPISGATLHALRAWGSGWHNGIHNFGVSDDGRLYAFGQFARLGSAKRNSAAGVDLRSWQLLPWPRTWQEVVDAPFTGAGVATAEPAGLEARLVFFDRDADKHAHASLSGSVFAQTRDAHGNQIVAVADTGVDDTALDLQPGTHPPIAATRIVALSKAKLARRWQSAPLAGSVAALASDGRLVVAVGNF